MDAAKVEVVLMVLEAALSQIKWRLKPSSKKRLQTDILALCSRMRPCVMVDYGGKMPELQDHLCACISYCKSILTSWTCHLFSQESEVFDLLNVMVIGDMVYLIQVQELRDFVTFSLDAESYVLLADLEHDPPKMITPTEKNDTAEQLLSAQKLFIAFLQNHEISEPSSVEGAPIQSLKFIDLSSFLEECQVTIPSLNGWLLGYPVIYLFSKDHIEDAIHNLSTKFLHIYQIFVGRANASGKGYVKEELLSFTVPVEMSMEGADEAWAKSFLKHMKEKWERCKEIWRSLDMEVTHCYPQAIAL